jgi:TetR/AcrR family transcriptional repressor of nem operon
MVETRRSGRGTTPDRILDVAEELVQTRGFNAFSYADVAAALGLTKAALHYHFPGKAELGEAVVSRYATRFLAALDAIDAGRQGARDKLESYADLYAGVLSTQRMCLCGMLAAEYTTLPEAIRRALCGFFDANDAWLSAVLELGRTEGSLSFDGEALETARLLVAALEGAMLVARPFNDAGRFATTARRLIDGLVGGVAPDRRRARRSARIP